MSTQTSSEDPSIGVKDDLIGFPGIEERSFLPWLICAKSMSLQVSLLANQRIFCGAPAHYSLVKCYWNAGVSLQGTLSGPAGPKIYRFRGMSYTSWEKSRFMRSAPRPTWSLLPAAVRLSNIFSMISHHVCRFSGLYQHRLGYSILDINFTIHGI